MIEILNGLHETVVHKDGYEFRLYDNDEATSYPDHWHAELEIIMPIDGPYYATIGNTEYVIREGDIFLINSAVIHFLAAPAQGRRLILQPGFSLLHSINGLESLFSFLPPALHITKEKDEDIHPRLREILLQIQQEYNQGLPFAEAAIYSLLIEAFVLIGRKYANRGTDLGVTYNKKREYAEKFNSICAYVSEHLAEDLDLESTAAMVGFSKFHFTRLFKQFTGYSFYKYLNHKRIEYAETLLMDPKISVTEVAGRSGYSSASTFIRMFKQIKGCTPSEFRSLYNG